MQNPPHQLLHQHIFRTTTIERIIITQTPDN